MKTASDRDMTRVEMWNPWKPFVFNGLHVEATSTAWKPFVFNGLAKANVFNGLARNALARWPILLTDVLMFSLAVFPGMCSRCDVLLALGA